MVKKSVSSKAKDTNVGYKYHEKGDEWSFTCNACKNTIYAPTKTEIQKQFIKHSLVKPIENRKCPAKW